MNNYYIVALNKSGVSLINLNNDMLNESEDKLHNLAYIDSITSRYDEDVFRRFLFNKKKIDNYFNPIYIVKYHMYKGNKVLKFYDLIFKNIMQDYLNKIALTTLRQRAITYGDVARLIDMFIDNYTNNEEYTNFADMALNQHQIEHLKKDFMKKTNDDLNYTTLRQIISSEYQLERHKTYEEYVYNNYKKEDYEKEILKLLPENKKESRLKVVKRYSMEELEKIKNGKWDNEQAKEKLENNVISRDMLATLTLEDLYRAGFIDYNEYDQTRMEKENKFHK